jgi:hypothetical protein
MQNETTRKLLSNKSQFITNDPNTCVQEELSNNEFQRTVKTINDLKEETQS